MRAASNGREAMCIHRTTDVGPKLLAAESRAALGPTPLRLLSPLPRGCSIVLREGAGPLHNLNTKHLSSLPPSSVNQATIAMFLRRARVPYAHQTLCAEWTVRVLVVLEALDHGPDGCRHLSNLIVESAQKPAQNVCRNDPIVTWTAGIQIDVGKRGARRQACLQERGQE